MTRATVAKTILLLPEAYLALLAEFPLRPIQNDAQCERATRMIHKLALREGRLGRDEQAYLDVLENLVERYETQHYAIETDQLTPTRALQALVRQAQMSVTDLGELLGSKGAASELLSGKRKEPSKSQIARLSARFRVDAGVFLLPARARAAKV